jgi:hypothetical protein
MPQARRQRGALATTSCAAREMEALLRGTRVATGGRKPTSDKDLADLAVEYEHLLSQGKSRKDLAAKKQITVRSAANLLAKLRREGWLERNREPPPAERGDGARKATRRASGKTPRRPSLDKDPQPPQPWEPSSGQPASQSQSVRNIARTPIQQMRGPGFPLGSNCSERPATRHARGPIAGVLSASRRSTGDTEQAPAQRSSAASSWPHAPRPQYGPHGRWMPLVRPVRRRHLLRVEARSDRATPETVDRLLDDSCFGLGTEAARTAPPPIVPPVLRSRPATHILEPASAAKCRRCSLRA